MGVGWGDLCIGRGSLLVMAGLSLVSPVENEKLPFLCFASKASYEVYVMSGGVLSAEGTVPSA